MDGWMDGEGIYLFMSWMFFMVPAGRDDLGCIIVIGFTLLLLKLDITAGVVGILFLDHAEGKEGDVVGDGEDEDAETEDHKADGDLEVAPDPAGPDLGDDFRLALVLVINFIHKMNDGDPIKDPRADHEKSRDPFHR